MIRSFLAIDLPPVVKEQLERTLAVLKPGTTGIKWVNPEQMHLTLKFFGTIPPEMTDRLAEAVSGAVRTCRPLALTLKGVGGFPNIRRPRVIWAGLGGDRESLKSLWLLLEETFAGMGISKEIRPFNPHLTLGRNKTGEPNEKLYLRLSNWTEPEGDPFVVQNLQIYKSDLKPGGPIYTVIKSFQFGRE